MCLFSVNVTEAKVYIDIDSPALRQFPMALYDFGDDKIGRELTAIVKDDLSFTTLFYFINKVAFIEDKGDDFNPANWTPIGAEAVLKGDITVTEKINVVVRLYDVVETRIIIYKQYSSNKSGLRSLAHKISNDIYLALTGRKGIFGTKIAFVSMEEKMKEMVLMDYDGGRVKRTKFRKEMMLSPHSSDDGSKLIISASNGRQWTIYLVDFNNVNSKKIFESRGVNIAGDFFKGSDSFIFSSSKAGSPDIYVYDLNSSKVRRITSNYWINISPTLSPDGKSVAYVSDKSGNPHIYIMNIDGYDAQRITFEGTYNTSPSWSPSGDLIAYSGMIGGKNQIFTVKPDGSDISQLTDWGNNEDPSFSPDGRFITFTSDRNGHKAIYIMTTGGENQKRISSKGYGAFGPEWLSN
jgi:TolB protein